MGIGPDVLYLDQYNIIIHSNKILIGKDTPYVQANQIEDVRPGFHSRERRETNRKA